MKPLFEAVPDLVLNVRPLYIARDLLRPVIDRLEQLKEDRAIVLVGALYIEYYLDEYLASIIPNFLKLARGDKRLRERARCLPLDVAYILSKLYSLASLSSSGKRF